MKLIDHTDAHWLQRFRRINGALTYSQDLVKYQVPNWEQVLGDDCIISTCPKFDAVSDEGRYRVAIQYLHSYPYSSAVSRTEAVLWNKKFRADKVIFVTAYKAFERELKDAGLNAVYIPMSIDVDEIAQYSKPKQYNHRIIYFGNIIQNKLNWYGQLSRSCQLTGWELDTISTCKFNKTRKLTREEMWETASMYKYGVGVGRCAQELHALGVKTLIGGHKFGGIITNNNEYRKQLETNMNGRIATFSDNLIACLNDIDKSIIKTTDIKNMNHAEIVKNEYAI